MPISELVLRQNSLFSEASSELVQWTCAHMEIYSLKRRQTLLSGGGYFKGLGLVVQGRMQATELTLDGQEVALRTAEQTELFGQENLLAPRPLEVTWMAPGPATVACMTTPHARQLLAQPEMVQRLAAEMAQRILDQLQWQKVLSAPTVTSKVCNWLIWSASGQAVNMPTHAEVAWRLNTTRESVSRVLQKLQAEGLLSRDEEGRWKIQNPSALRGLAKGEDK